MGEHVTRAQDTPAPTAPAPAIDAGPAPAAPVPLPVRPRVIRRQKADAESYANTEGIMIDGSRQSVIDYVTDATNPEDQRRGLLQAWNKDQQPRWVIETPADLAAPANPFHHSTFPAYQSFDKQSTGVAVTAFGGSTSARYLNGAPFISSRVGDFGGASLGSTYADFIAGLRSNGRSDADIAKTLLSYDEASLTSQLELRAAAMMTVTVYLAEEWRKQGAAKIYRANLRLIAEGKRTFEEFRTAFAFIESADAGRRQVGSFYDVSRGDAPLSTLSKTDRATYDEMSELDSGDFSSDDELRTDDRKNLSKKRLFAKKHDGSPL